MSKDHEPGADISNVQNAEAFLAPMVSFPGLSRAMASLYKDMPLGEGANKSKGEPAQPPVAPLTVDPGAWDSAEVLPARDRGGGWRGREMPHLDCCGPQEHGSHCTSRDEKNKMRDNPRALSHSQKGKFRCLPVWVKT